MSQELGIPHSPVIVLSSRICISVKDFWLSAPDITLSHMLNSSPSQSLEWLLVYLLFVFLFLLPLPSRWHSKLGCLVLCVSSRVAAGSHLRTFIRKMMHEAQGTQLDFQSPDWGCCWSTWRSFWHANLARFWYKGEWWMIKSAPQHIHLAVWTLIRAARRCDRDISVCKQLSCRNPCCGTDRGWKEQNKEQ